MRPVGAVGANLVVLGLFLIYALGPSVNAPGETGKGVRTDCAIWYTEGNMTSEERDFCWLLSLQVLFLGFVSPAMVLLGGVLLAATRRPRKARAPSGRDSSGQSTPQPGDRRSEADRPPGSGPT